MDPLMKRLTLFAFSFLLFLSACASAPTQMPNLPFVVTISPEIRPFNPLKSPEPPITEPPALSGAEGQPVLATAFTRAAHRNICPHFDTVRSNAHRNAFAAAGTAHGKAARPGAGALDWSAHVPRRF
jgi:hypothetical protein